MASAAKVTAAGKGSGKRRRYAGKTGIRVKVKGGYAVVPRAHSHGGHSAAAIGFECGQDKPYGSKVIPGQFRVSMPRNRAKFSIPVLPIGR